MATKQADSWETTEVTRWLSNEPRMYYHATLTVEDEGSVEAAARALEEHYTEEAERLFGDDRGMFHSLLVNGALEEVDWYTVAQAFKPEAWGERDEAPDERCAFCEALAIVHCDECAQPACSAHGHSDGEGGERCQDHPFEGEAEQEQQHP
jgi:hypothetical protein